MKQFPKQARIKISSGVRGRKVYELTKRRQLVTGPSNSLDVVIKQRFVNSISPVRIRAHNALLDPIASGDYELLIPVSGTSAAVRVHVRFDTKPTLVGGIHGVEQGPAQYELTRDSSGWQAKIEVNETLHRRDIPFVVGHELDEIALIVRQEPASDAAMLAQARASLFKPGSTSINVTAHDRAAARELCALWEDYQHPPRRTDSASIKKRGDRLLRMLEAMGLKESVYIFDKLRVLRAEGAAGKLLRQIGIPEALKNYTGSAGFHSLQAKYPSLRSIIDEDLISHLMIPLDPGYRPFLGAGIQGGHHDGLLNDFVNNHPKIVIVKEAEKIAGGIVYRKYSQYRFLGSGPKPTPHDKRFPKAGDAAAGTYHSDWIVAKQGGMPRPKTTFSSLPPFLLVVDEVWHHWYEANKAHLPTGTNRFTHFLMGPGILLTGFFQNTSKGLLRLTTVYVEASWF